MEAQELFELGVEQLLISSNKDLARWLSADDRLEIFITVLDPSQDRVYLDVDALHYLVSDFGADISISRGTACEEYNPLLAEHMRDLVEEEFIELACGAPRMLSELQVQELHSSFMDVWRNNAQVYLKDRPNIRFLILKSAPVGSSDLENNEIWRDLLTPLGLQENFTIVAN